MKLILCHIMLFDGYVINYFTNYSLYVYAETRQVALFHVTAVLYTADNNRLCLQL